MHGCFCVCVTACVFNVVRAAEVESLKAGAVFPARAMVLHNRGAVFVGFALGAAASTPLFPGGADAVIGDVVARVARAEGDSAGDAAALEQLKEQGVASLAAALAQDALDDQTSEYVRALVGTKLAKQMYIGGCPRDYAGCPVGWLTSGSACMPPEDYDGLCTAVGSEALSDDEKEAFAWKCKASWPCKAACKLDFSGCPQQWTHGGGLCMAPPSYDGMCSPAMQFASFAAHDKAKWASVCNARWPCAAE